MTAAKPNRGRVGTEGLALFATPHPRAPHYDRIPVVPSIAGCATSEAAAERVEATGTAARQRDRILAYLRSRPDGATAAEVEAATGIEGSACRPRLLELAHGVGTQKGLGLIERTEATRIVPGHRAAYVWRIYSNGDSE